MSPGLVWNTHFSCFKRSQVDSLVLQKQRQSKYLDTSAPHHASFLSLTNRKSEFSGGCPHRDMQLQNSYSSLISVVFSMRVGEIGAREAHVFKEERRERSTERLY